MDCQLKSEKIVGADSFLLPKFQLDKAQETNSKKNQSTIPLISRQADRQTDRLIVELIDWQPNRSYMKRKTGSMTGRQFFVEKNGAECKDPGSER